MKQNERMERQAERGAAAIKKISDGAGRVKVHVMPDRMGVETTNVKMSMNPFCEIANEEALCIRDAGASAEVIAATVGPA